MAFDVATYTDVVASEAIDGVDGFNFQSISKGVTGIDQQRIRQSLLHRVVSSWALEHDPLAHPATCAYIAQDGRFYLSRGKSTGNTNNGRPGNQLTQTIATSDADDFVPFRPAQLYGAAEWTLEKAPSSTSDTWVTPLDIRPEFEVDALAALVVDDEWGSSILPHYLTMVDAAIGAEPKKLVLLHSDLDVVMQWIALGTLFVDTEAARVLQFRALVDDPRRVDAVFIGVSPEFGSADLGAANVLDLSGRTRPSIEPSESARVRAAWFIDHGADDALNAIEIARRWEPSLGPDLANDAAQVVGLPDAVTPGRTAWQAAMASIEKLAAAGLRDDLSLYSEELGEAAVGYAPKSTEEFSLAGRAIRSVLTLEVDGLTAGILVPTLEALTVAPESIGALSREISGSSKSVRWESSDDRNAAGAFVGELMNSAATDDLPVLFAAAKVIDAPVSEPALGTPVQRLATAWATNPEIGRTSWQSWLAGRTVAIATAEQVAENLRADNGATLRQLMAGHWDFLERDAGGAGLRRWLESARLARTPVEERHRHADLIARSPAEAWRVALADSSIPKHARLWAEWIYRHGVSADLAADLRRELGQALAAKPGANRSIGAGEWNPIMDSILRSKSRHVDRELADLASEYRLAYDEFGRTYNDVSKDSRAPLGRCLSHLGRLTPLLLSDIGWLLLNSSNRREVEKLLRAAHPWGPEALRIYIPLLPATRSGVRELSRAFGLRSDPDKYIAAAANDGLTELFQTRPDLVDLVNRFPKLRSEMEVHLRQGHGAQAIKRVLTSPFRRNKEK